LVKRTSASLNFPLVLLRKSVRVFFPSLPTQTSKTSVCLDKDLFDPVWDWGRCLCRIFSHFVWSSFRFKIGCFQACPCGLTLFRASFPPQLSWQSCLLEKTLRSCFAPFKVMLAWLPTFPPPLLTGNPTSSFYASTCNTSRVTPHLQKSTHSVNRTSRESPLSPLFLPASRMILRDVPCTHSSQRCSFAGPPPGASPRILL